jgi:GDP-L-fucose synthase
MTPGRNGLLTSHTTVDLGRVEEIAISDLASLMTTEVGFTGKITRDTSKPDWQPQRCLDVSRAQQLIGS